jgi:spore coat polysaccharide biosynthesis predicted glycosyltransferase SpsG
MSRVVFVCDAGPIRGIGHVMRCLALAEEMAERGTRCVFVADLVDVPWAADQIRSRHFTVREHAADAPSLADAVLSFEPAAVVVDSYHSPRWVSAAIRSAGVPVLAIIDGDARDQVGDIYVDQNLDAERRPGPVGSPRLAGIEYALLRNEVLALRSAIPPSGARHEPPHVLAYFGGTDAYGASPAVMTALARSGERFHATVVAPRPSLQAELAELPLASGQRLSVIGPTDTLMGLAADADLVIGASGTSVWELMSIGSAAALVWVADNQEQGYERVVASGAAAGLGHLDDVRADPSGAAGTLGKLLRDVTLRDKIRATGWSMVDGLGRARVATALMELIASTSRAPAV